jgi:hypothetical protein
MDGQAYRRAFSIICSFYALHTRTLKKKWLLVHFKFSKMTLKGLK